MIAPGLIKIGQPASQAIATQLGRRTCSRRTCVPNGEISTPRRVEQMDFECAVLWNFIAPSISPRGSKASLNRG
jgi:hypothetical protein